MMSTDVVYRDVPISYIRLAVSKLLAPRVAVKVCTVPLTVPRLSAKVPLFTRDPMYTEAIVAAGTFISTLAAIPEGPMPMLLVVALTNPPATESCPD